MEEDIFDQDASEMEVISQEWNQVCQSRLKNGFVEGATVGQQHTIQNGFNTGFKQGLLSCFLLSKVKGILDGLMAYQDSYEGDPISDDIIIDAYDIMETISTLETDGVAEDFLSMSLNSSMCSRNPAESNPIVDMVEMDMDLNSADACEGCSCVGKNSKLEDNNCCSTETTSITEGSIPPKLGDKTLEDARTLLLTCPQIHDVVQRCKTVLRRLKWSDAMVDQLI
uniref:Essential protein Yae1 N-terminal domain-containing protein n=1 Tax=Ciona savignyi TaxID=51511 RepID=H2ZD72_CIOSA